MIFGMDYLAGATYQSLIVKNHPKGWAAGFFGNTFGNAYPAIRALAKSGKCPIIRVHAIWDDNHKYDAKKHYPMIKNQFNRCIAAARKFPKVQFQFSPMCEHTIPKDEFDKLILNLRVILPDDVDNIIFVNCSLKGDYIYDSKMIVNECHNVGSVPKKGKYNFSYDGVDCYNADVEKDKKKQSKADIFFFWTVSYNLKKNEKDKRSVEQRVKDGFRPNATNIEACAIMAENKKVATTPNTWIVKPMSEYCGDAKSNKLLIMIPNTTNAKKLQLKRSGKVYAELSRFTPDTDGKGRYYAPQAGCKYGNQLYSVWIDGKRSAYTVNPAFRGGSYR